jgi:hypothetical protein
VDYSADAQEPVECLNPVSPENGFSNWRVRLKWAKRRVATELKNEYVIGLSNDELGEGRASFFRKLGDVWIPEALPSKSNATRIPDDAIRWRFQF